MMPMDNSTDPPFRDLTLENLKNDFGELSNMTPGVAFEVLSEVVHSPPWMRVGESEYVLRQLIGVAGLWSDKATLADLGLEDLSAD